MKYVSTLRVHETKLFVVNFFFENRVSSNIVYLEMKKSNFSVAFFCLFFYRWCHLEEAANNGITNFETRIHFNWKSREKLKKEHPFISICHFICIYFCHGRVRGVSLILPYPSYYKGPQKWITNWVSKKIWREIVVKSNKGNRGASLISVSLSKKREKKETQKRDKWAHL